MRIICPNCERKGLIDPAALSDTPTRAACPRCGVPFRIRLLDSSADARVAPSPLPLTVNAPVNAARVERTITLSSFTRLAQLASPYTLDRSALRASDDDPLTIPDSDVFALPDTDAPALPLEDAPVDTREATNGGVLDLEVDARANSSARASSHARDDRSTGELSLADAVSFADEVSLVDKTPSVDEASPMVEVSSYVEGSFAHDSRAHGRARRADAVDKYRIAVRMMNASPLWLVAAGLGFVALVFVFDLLLAPAAPARDDVSALAAPQNQATNRDAARTRRDRDAEEAGDSSTRVAQEEAAKPAAISDAAAPSNSTAPSYMVASSGATSSSNAASSSEIVAPRDASNADAPSLAHLTIQIASYRTAEEAEDQVAGLRAAGFDAHVVKEQTSKRPWYFAQTGSFASRAEAMHRLSELRAKGFAAQYTIREVE